MGKLIMLVSMSKMSKMSGSNMVNQAKRLQPPVFMQYTVYTLMATASTVATSCAIAFGVRNGMLIMACERIVSMPTTNANLVLDAPSPDHRF